MPARLRDLTGDVVADHARAVARYARDGVDEAPAEGIAALRLLVVAATARARLRDGESLSSGEVAALAGLDDSYIRRFVRAGEIAVEDPDAYHARIPAEVASAWLAERGVPGF